MTRELLMLSAVIPVLLAVSTSDRVVAAEPEADPEANPQHVVLDAYSMFRCHFEQNGRYVKREDGTWWPHEPKGGSQPPANWQAADFDDSEWVAIPGPFFATGRYARYGFDFRTGVPGDLSTICLRTGFTVADPAKAGELKMDLDFRGGVVVYFNGEEIARSHLPEGEIKPLTLADPYPKEAYVNPEGTVILGGWEDPDRYRDRVEKRVRTIRNLVIPERLIRKGENVLAIRLQSAPLHEVTLTKTKQGDRFYGFRSAPMQHAHWVTVGMPAIVLRASGTGVQGSLVRPEGFQVYNHSPFHVVYDIDYVPPGTPLRPMRISGARNGSFAAQVVVARDQPIVGLEAAVSALQREGGGGTIPASALRLRYPQPTLPAPYGYERLPGAHPGHTHINVFDSLFEEPPANLPVRMKDRQESRRPFVFGALQPIWLTVDIPADASPGEYTGQLTVQAAGLDPVVIPVHVAVSEWVVPPPHQWRTFCDFMQSSESLSIYYGTTMWSDEHWRQIERSLNILGSVGNKSLYLMLVAKTANGNSQTILRWIKQPDGSLKPDFTLVDRYLELAGRHLVKPQVVCLYVWDRPLGGGYFGTDRSRGRFEMMPPEVTVYDPATDSSSLYKAPEMDDYEGRNFDRAKALAFWKPAVEGLKQRFEKLGWTDAVMLGIGDDWIPSKTYCALWKELLPEAKWVSMSHGISSNFYRIVDVGYATTVWNPRWASSPSDRFYGWNRKELVCHYDRDSWRAPAQDQLFGRGYMAGDLNICGAQRGFGRMNGDYFVVGAGGDNGLICGRYQANKAQLTLRMLPYIWPGPKLPVSTTRLEMIREGLIECEARITLEAAMLDESARAKLGADRVRAFEQLLDEKTRWTLNSSRFGGYSYMSSNWRGLRARLFDAAAEVHRILGN